MCFLAQYEVAPARSSLLREGLIPNHIVTMNETEKIVQCLPPNDKRFIDLTGQKFGRLTIIAFYGRSLSYKKRTHWKAKCECGNITYPSGSDLRSGDCNSCGCIREDIRTNEADMPDPPEGQKYIPLTRGKFAIVDEGDFEEVSKSTWTFDGIYPTRNLGGGRMQRLHNFLMPLPKPLEVDHRNKNTLDNRRSNLRQSTRSQNGANRRRHKNNTTGFKGVFLDKRSGKFVARICFENKATHLGTFSSAKDASNAYIAACKAIHGEFASL
jgi:hypothetical protein